MKLVTTRGLTIDISATACAFANAASVAFLSPSDTSNSTLPGCWAQTCGASCPDRMEDADHRRQRRPVDLDRLDRIARPIDGVGDDERNGVADMTHLVPGKDRIGRPGKGIDFEIEQARQVAEIPDILRREDERDPGQAAGARGVDGELRMRMRRAQHQCMQRRRRSEIVGVAALAANQRVVLLAKHALTDAEFDGSHPISIRLRGRFTTVT